MAMHGIGAFLKYMSKKLQYYSKFRFTKDYTNIVSRSGCPDLKPGPRSGLMALDRQPCLCVQSSQMTAQFIFKRHIFDVNIQQISVHEKVY